MGCLRGPGPINRIGEHTDFNDGFALPLAIDRAIWIALYPRVDPCVSVHCVDYDEFGEFLLDAPINENAGSGGAKRSRFPQHFARPAHCYCRMGL